MFTVKLGTGKTFEASSVDERWQSASFLDKPESDSMIVLDFEITPSKSTVEDYFNLLFEEGALGTIQVLLANKTEATYVGYTTVGNISVRLLSTGDKSASIQLLKK